MYVRWEIHLVKKLLTPQCTHHVRRLRLSPQFGDNSCDRSPFAMAAPSSPAFANINPMLFPKKSRHEDVDTNLQRVASASRNGRGVTRGSDHESRHEGDDGSNHHNHGSGHRRTRSRGRGHRRTRSRGRSGEDRAPRRTRDDGGDGRGRRSQGCSSPSRGRGRGRLEDVELANFVDDNDDDVSGNIVSGSSLAGERTSQRPSRGHSTSRDRRQESHCAVGGAEDGLEGGSRAGSGVHFLKDTKRGDLSSDSYMDPGGMATARGMEPAVQGCGVMSTPTFLKLVRS